MRRNTMAKHRQQQVEAKQVTKYVLIKHCYILREANDVCDDCKNSPLRLLQSVTVLEKNES